MDDNVTLPMTPRHVVLCGLLGCDPQRIATDLLADPSLLHPNKQVVSLEVIRGLSQLQRALSWLYRQFDLLSMRQSTKPDAEFWDPTQLIAALQAPDITRNRIMRQPWDRLAIAALMYRVKLRELQRALSTGCGDPAIEFAVRTLLGTLATHGL